MNDIVKISIPLLDEGTPMSRPTQAISLGEGKYRVLPMPNHEELTGGEEPDETWEFEPGSIVRCEIATNPLNGTKYLRAVEVQQADGSFRRSTVFE